MFYTLAMITESILLLMGEYFDFFKGIIPLGGSNLTQIGTLLLIANIAEGLLKLFKK